MNFFDFKKKYTLNNINYKNISISIYSSPYFYQLGENTNNKYFTIYIDNIAYQSKDYIELHQDPYIRSMGILSGEIRDIDNLSYSFNSKIINSLIFGNNELTPSAKLYKFCDFERDVQINLEKLEMEYLEKEVYNPELDFLKNIIPYLIKNKEKNESIIKNSFLNYDSYETIVDSMSYYIKTVDSIDKDFIIKYLRQISFTNLYKETQSINCSIKDKNKNVFSSKII